VPNAQVLNFGVPGYGPIQDHLLTEKVLSFEPNAVVIAFGLGNDFVDNVITRMPLSLLNRSIASVRLMFMCHTIASGFGKAWARF
jgi:hypothetical protein